MRDGIWTRSGSPCATYGGTHFKPYVALAVTLGLPFAVITDWDPVAGGEPSLGWHRALSLVEHALALRGKGPLNAALKKKLAEDEKTLREVAAKIGIFMNSDTLEVEMANTPPLLNPLIDILEGEQFGPKRRARLKAWKADPSSIDGEQLLAMIADVGKGRLAARLAAKAVGLKPPAYIKDALARVV